MRIICGSNTVGQIAQAIAGIIRRKVVYCPSVGDAASPVWLIAGDYSRQLGQCADYRHHVEDAADRQDAVLVSGWWTEEYGWVAGVANEAVAGHERAILGLLGPWATTVAATEARAAAEHRRLVRSMEEFEAERPAREARLAAGQAEVAARRELLRPVYELAMRGVRIAKQTGLPDRGAARDVETAYTLSCEGYDYDRAHHERRLRVLAGLDPWPVVTPATDIQREVWARYYAQHPAGQ